MASMLSRCIKKKKLFYKLQIFSKIQQTSTTTITIRSLFSDEFIAVYYAGCRSQPPSYIRERIPFVSLGVKNCLVFLTFPYPAPVPKNCVIFIGYNFKSRASQVGLHKQKKDTASAKKGKVSLQRSGGQRLKAVLQIYRRKTWPRATENIVKVAQPGDLLLLVCC